MTELGKNKDLSMQDKMAKIGEEWSKLKPLLQSGEASMESFLRHPVASSVAASLNHHQNQYEVKSLSSLDNKIKKVTDFYCVTCDKYCKSQYHLDVHYASKEHKKQEKMMDNQPTRGQDNPLTNFTSPSPRNTPIGQPSGTQRVNQGVNQSQIHYVKSPNNTQNNYADSYNSHSIIYADSGLKNSRSETTQSKVNMPSSQMSLTGKRKSSSSNMNNVNRGCSKVLMNQQNGNGSQFQYGYVTDIRPNEGYMQTEIQYPSKSQPGQAQPIVGYRGPYAFSEQINIIPHGPPQTQNSQEKNRSDNEDKNTSLSSLANHVNQIYLDKKSKNINKITEINKQIIECQNSTVYQGILKHREKISELKSIIEGFESLNLKYRKNDDNGVHGYGPIGPYGYGRGNGTLSGLYQPLQYQNSGINQGQFAYQIHDQIRPNNLEMNYQSQNNFDNMSSGNVNFRQDGQNYNVYSNEYSNEMEGDMG